MTGLPPSQQADRYREGWLLRGQKLNEVEAENRRLRAFAEMVASYGGANPFWEDAMTALQQQRPPLPTCCPECDLNEGHDGSHEFFSGSAHLPDEDTPSGRER